ncbi:MAG TPA: hypothetical protein VHV09_12095 [Trebonia sp.]|nr:hypothetical protein [Trebonia sp.]
MLGSFWDAVGGKLADRWAAVGAPGVVFWLGGLLAWALGTGGLHRLAVPAHWLDKQTTATQVIALLVALLGVAASVIVINRLTLPALRVLEGYWPRPLHRLAEARVRHLKDEARDDDLRLRELAPLVRAQPGTPPPATAAQLAEWARLDQRRHRRPPATVPMLPTRLGNTLRAAESWPARKYGLDAVTVWPRLWLVLPDRAIQELVAARATLDSSAAVAVWGLLFCFFGIWTPLAVVPGLAVAAVAVTVWAPPRAETFADLVEAAYDLYRPALYQQLRWPLPANPAEEREQGRMLTTYLWRGSQRTVPEFTPPSPNGGQ